MPAAVRRLLALLYWASKLFSEDTEVNWKFGMGMLVVQTMLSLFFALPLMTFADV